MVFEKGTYRGQFGAYAAGDSSGSPWTPGS